jgi:hypothetical protein
MFSHYYWFVWIDPVFGIPKLQIFSQVPCVGVLFDWRFILKHSSERAAEDKSYSDMLCGLESLCLFYGHI